MKRLLFVISEDRYFVSHRLHLAKKAMEEGFQVGFSGNVSAFGQLLEDEGIDVLEWKHKRGSINPWIELQSMFQLARLILRFRPDVVHAVASKPVFYSSVICKIFRIRSRVFALAGLGYVFSSEKKKARLLRPFLVGVFRFSLSGKKTRLILQNPDDQAMLLKAGVIRKEKIRLIRGAGVDTELFSPILNHQFESGAHGILQVILPARMLWSKGIGDFIACARALLKKGVNAHFILVGDPDQENPESTTRKQLQEWSQENGIEWWGQCENMTDIMRQASIVCLPSDREGLPKSLLEAASCSKPIVTYDVPGCREIVIDGKNGFLIPPKDIEALTQAIWKLLENSKLREKMGNAGRALVLKEFSQEKVAAQTIQIWQEVLS